MNSTISLVSPDEGLLVRINKKSFMPYKWIIHPILSIMATSPKYVNIVDKFNYINRVKVINIAFQENSSIFIFSVSDAMDDMGDLTFREEWMNIITNKIEFEFDFDGLINVINRYYENLVQSVSDENEINED